MIEQTEEVPDVNITDLLEQKLVVFNDDHNSFDHVIRTFMRVLKHTHTQAEQCAYIIHIKGRCTVREGMYDMLKPLRDKIREVGIDARIE